MRKNNRERILKTARQLLPRYGYNGISIRAIAEKAKLTTGAIYFHFKDKMDIYKTICFEAIDMLIANFRERMESRKTPSQKLISTFDSYIDFFYNHQDHYNILMEYKAHYDPDVKDDHLEVTKKLSEMYELMEETIRAGIQDGSFREIDPRMLSVLLAAVTEGMLQLKKLGIFDYMKISDENFRRFMGDTIGRGILNERVK
ncbi:MAG TPA: TetR/AcrR family transcriptional regulator [Spirochaetota bacterium]|nr:TetR/AcrR family transcriptional regulator [Spirochaetota bacterium]HPC39904.1 TetR/AcrR family transcriptional regulator [Spirochaetota bacterium]HQF08920.1 TetR/AcrR family transcriptional regulator [Spirochaetota bacterium]HQH97846.1 TetR/AcrR family transcriptional regulator [Spirochaetota bacterium]HQJ71522.1 TetR/AcrR family transcriptional regulator [Spirochaetota bacterium]